MSCGQKAKPLLSDLGEPRGENVQAPYDTRKGVWISKVHR